MFFRQDGRWSISAVCSTEDGRSVHGTYDAGDQDAANVDRMKSVIEGQIGKATGNFRFRVAEMTSAEGMPFISASAVNAIRRDLAAQLDLILCIKRDLLKSDIHTDRDSDKAPKEISYKSNVSNKLSASVYTNAGAESVEEAYELTHTPNAELMRSKYCIRYELNMCPVHHKAKNSGPLFLLNNGKHLQLLFDCKNCEMIVMEVKSNTQPRLK
jgi:putative protease